MVKKGEVKCPLPPTPVELSSQAGTSGMTPAPFVTLRLAVSNDGQLVSNSMPVIVYDSKCMSCALDAPCVKKVIANTFIYSFHF